MDGATLKAYRTERGLYQQGLAELLTENGVEVDQPMVSEIERGKVPMPPEVEAAILGGLEGAPDPLPPSEQPQTKPRRQRKSMPRREQPAAAAEPVDPPAEPTAAEPGNPPPVDPVDVPPRPLPGPGAQIGPTATPWSADARNQLERDLRKLFKGETFLVPVPKVEGPDEYHEAQMPGIAQLVGLIDPYDGRVIELNADAMAKAWTELADESTAVRRVLMMLTYGGAWRGVIATTLPVLYSIGVHHGLIPPILGAAAAAPERHPTMPADAAAPV